MKQYIQNDMKVVNVNVHQMEVFVIINNVIINNNKCNNNCRCEWKELIYKGICDKSFISNPSNCKRECDKSYDVRKYLDYQNCTCRKEIVDK